MTDVILYVQIDRDKDSINVLQIPRDSYVGEYIAEGVPGNTGKINEVYSKYICGDKLPARSCVEVARLPKDGLVEIEVIALKK